MARKSHTNTAKPCQITPKLPFAVDAGSETRRGGAARSSKTARGRFTWLAAGRLMAPRRAPRGTVGALAGAMRRVTLTIRRPGHRRAGVSGVTLWRRHGLLAWWRSPHRTMVAACIATPGLGPGLWLCRARWGLQARTRFFHSFLSLHFFLIEESISAEKE
jgi:hypothetical protein